MIKTSSLKPVTYAGAFLFAAALVGCGDDGGPTPQIDAGAIDAPETPIDAPTADACVGHGCPDIMSPFQLAEGGEIRLERLQTGLQQNDFYLASQAFFFTNQDPPIRPLSVMELTLAIRDEIRTQGYRATDRRPGYLFENGASPEGQMIADTRDYYDVGAEVRLSNADDAADVITMTRRMNEVDLSAQIMHDIIYRGPDAQDVSRNRTYKPDIDGSQEYPLLSLKYGKSAVQEPLADPETGVGDVLVYMPSQFTLTSPTEDVYFDEAGLVFTKGQDLTITYTPDEATPEGWPTILVFGAFVNASGQVVASVLKAPTPAGAPDNGTFIVPHEILEILADETPGRFIFGRLAHTAWEYTGDGTRVDSIGIDCKAAPKWVIQEAGN